MVNDKSALDFADFAYAGNIQNGLHQPKSLPVDTGTPVVFAGSTTGPKYTQSKCSALAGHLERASAVRQDWCELAAQVGPGR